MLRKHEAVEKPEIRLAERLRKASKEGISQEAKQTDLEQLRQEFNERRSRQLAEVEKLVAEVREFGQLPKKRDPLQSESGQIR